MHGETVKLKKKKLCDIAFLLQKWLHERGSMLRYTYIACLVLLLVLLVYSGPGGLAV